MAIQTEQANADPPKRKRRWFQFSLRSLMIGVALLAVPFAYVGWQMKKIRERTAVFTWLEKRKPIDAPLVTPDWDIAQNENNRWEIQFDDDDLSWWRQLLGDHKVISVRYPRPATESEVERVKAAFPEVNDFPYGIQG